MSALAAATPITIYTLAVGGGLGKTHAQHTLIRQHTQSVVLGGSGVRAAQNARKFAESQRDEFSGWMGVDGALPLAH